VDGPDEASANDCGTDVGDGQSGSLEAPDPASLDDPRGANRVAVWGTPRRGSVWRGV
jgi:hypothetical protein